MRDENSDWRVRKGMKKKEKGKLSNSSKRLQKLPFFHIRKKKCLEAVPEKLGQSRFGINKYSHRIVYYFSYRVDPFRKALKLYKSEKLCH
jgi:hypothetical protein